MKEQEKKAIIVTDLGYGDSGKGTTVDFLSREKDVHTVVRFNGGAQAAHNVITPDGRHHTFSQFSSGTFVPGVRTHLSRFMMVNPLNMIPEEKHLRELGVTDAFERTTVDSKALVTTPFHRAINRLEEMKRDQGRHGSCGMGIGETMSDFLTHGDQVLFMGDLKDENRTQQKLKFIQELKLQKLQTIKGQLSSTPEVEQELKLLQDPEIASYLADLYSNLLRTIKVTDDDYFKNVLAKSGTILFEGAQGVLLDQKYGFQPYTTWSNTTFDNALTLLDENNYDGSVTKLGVIRAYQTRHGAGPFVTEDQLLTRKIPDSHNITNDWQQNFRIGYLDIPALQYAIDACGGIDRLAVTCLDKLPDLTAWRICRGYLHQGERDGIDQYFETWEDLLTKIRFNKQTTFSQQEELTKMLFKSKPVYGVVTGNSAKDFLSYIEQQLQTPISIASFGPTAEDKRLI